MDFKTFLEHFDTIADAPNGIPKLRSLILDLAVQGKLVSQNPEDESADKLFEKIQESRELLYSKKQAIKKKDFLPFDCGEIPFLIPGTWKWTKLHELCWLITDGTHHTPTYVEAGIPFLSVKNLSAGYLDFSSTRFVNRETHAELCARCKPEYGDILLTKVGTTGIAVEIDTAQEFSIFVSVALLKHFSAFTYPKFLTYLLNSSFVKAQSKAGTEGVGNKNLVLRKIYNFIVPLPPLAEQKRIVEKVDELMALCDRLQAAKQTRDTLRQKLRGSAIDSLMNAQTDEELQKGWAIVRDNWVELSQSPEDVGDLRRSVLYLAVRGKLVPQNINDEPAEKLLKIISTCHSADSKKFRKPKNLLPIENVNKPFDLPCGWDWCRFTDIGLLERGKSKHRPRNDPALYENGSIPLIQTGDVARANGLIATYTALYNKNGLAQSRLWSKGTLCITIAANIGDTAILGFDACFPDSVVGFLPTAPIEDSKYFEFFLRTLKSSLENFAPSTAQKNINLAILDEVLIPLPSLAEQKRIVAKVNELMQMCDRLEESLRQSQQWAEALAASAINHLTI